MSYALSAPLQAAIYGRLASDAGLQALIGVHVYDAMPTGQLPDVYVSLGAEAVRDASDADAPGAWHDLTISVISQSAGFQTAKQASAAICDALIDADLALTRGQLIGLWFRKAQAKRVSGGIRRIDMTFRARVEDN